MADEYTPYSFLVQSAYAQSAGSQHVPYQFQGTAFDSLKASMDSAKADVQGKEREIEAASAEEDRTRLQSELDGTLKPLLEEKKADMRKFLDDTIKGFQGDIDYLRSGVEDISQKDAAESRHQKANGIPTAISAVWHKTSEVTRELGLEQGLRELNGNAHGLLATLNERISAIDAENGEESELAPEDLLFAKDISDQKLVNDSLLAEVRQAGTDAANLASQDSVSQSSYDEIIKRQKGLETRYYATTSLAEAVNDRAQKQQRAGTLPAEVHVALGPFNSSLRDISTSIDSLFTSTEGLKGKIQSQQTSSSSTTDSSTTDSSTTDSSTTDSSTTDSSTTDSSTTDSSTTDSSTTDSSSTDSSSTGGTATDKDTSTTSPPTLVDTTKPSFRQGTMDMTTGILTLQFSEPIDRSNIDSEDMVLRAHDRDTGLQLRGSALILEDSWLRAEDGSPDTLRYLIPEDKRGSLVPDFTNSNLDIKIEFYFGAVYDLAGNSINSDPGHRSHSLSYVPPAATEPDVQQPAITFDVSKNGSLGPMNSADFVTNLDFGDVYNVGTGWNLDNVIGGADLNIVYSDNIADGATPPVGQHTVTYTYNERGTVRFAQIVETVIVSAAVPVIPDPDPDQGNQGAGGNQPDVQQPDVVAEQREQAAANGQPLGVEEVAPKKKSGGGSGSDWKVRPTFGLSHNTNSQLVYDGFTLNGHTTHINDNWHTEWLRTSSVIGEENHVRMVAYAADGFKYVTLSLGVPEIGKSVEAETAITLNLDKDYGKDLIYSVSEITHEQEENLIDESRTEATVSQVYCNPSSNAKNCYAFDVWFTVMAPLSHDVIAIAATDEKRRAQTTYVNDGVEFTGMSLLPSETKELWSDGDWITLVKDDRRYDTWTDNDGYKWEENGFGTMTQVTHPDFERFQDDHSTVMNRLNSNFGLLIQHEKENALKVWNGTHFTLE